jgi:hypothetical protein
MPGEFSDRFNTADDKAFFVKSIEDVFEKNFKQPWSSISPSHAPVFSSIFSRSRSYQLTRLTLEEQIQTCLDLVSEQNHQNTTQLDIIILKEAVEHIVSLARVLQMPRATSSPSV